MGGHLGGRDSYIGDGGRGGTVGGKGQLHGRWWEGRKCRRGETATWEMVGGEGLWEWRGSYMGDGPPGSKMHASCMVVRSPHVGINQGSDTKQSGALARSGTGDRLGSNQGAIMK